MPTIQLHLAVTLGDDAAKTLAELIGPALRQAISAGSPFDEARQARIRTSQRALLAGQKIPEDQGLLVDTNEAAKLLKVSAARS